MSLSGELLALHEREDEYRGDLALVRPLIQEKKLHMVVAAEKMGTSTSLEKVVKILPDSARAAILGSRAPKVGDPLNYQTAAVGMNIQKLKYMITDEALVNYVVLPTGEVFGTLPESFPAKHNFLHTIPSGIEQLEQAGFEDTTLTYMYMATAAWKGQVFKRRNMENSIASFKFGIANAEDLNFVKNRVGRQDETARDIIRVTLGETTGYDKNKAVEDLKELLAMAQDLAVQSK